MARLCFLTTCMGRLDHLKRALERIDEQRDSECVVVDYSCPDRCGDWVESNYPRIRVVRIPGRTSFNRSQAANAGSRAVESAWICFCDCDILFDRRFTSRILPLLEPGGYYCPDPIRDWALCGTFICAREDFERIGGYDEVYRGWGERDLDVYCALELAGLRRRGFPASLLQHISHGEGARVQFHEVKERHLMQTINRIYRFVKFDVMRASRQPLSLQAREDLYNTVAVRTRFAIQEGLPLDLSVSIRDGDQVLHYEIKGLRGRPVSRVVGTIHRSPLANRLHRFVKAGLLRRPLNLTREIYDRHLPYGLRLEARAVSTT